jgi:putative oxidoreductase
MFHIFISLNNYRNQIKPMRAYTKYQNASLLFLRIVTAAIFYVAAYYKFPFWSGAPEGISPFMLFTTRLLSIVEPLGATALLFGFLTRWAAVGLIIILLGAIYVSQFVYGIGFVTPTSPGWDFPLAVLAGCFILVAFGPGKWAVDKGRK